MADRPKRNASKLVSYQDYPDNFDPVEEHPRSRSKHGSQSSSSHHSHRNRSTSGSSSSSSRRSGSSQQIPLLRDRAYSTRSSQRLNYTETDEEDSDLFSQKSSQSSSQRAVRRRSSRHQEEAVQDDDDDDDDEVIPNSQPQPQTPRQRGRPRKSQNQEKVEEQEEDNGQESMEDEVTIEEQEDDEGNLPLHKSKKKNHEEEDENEDEDTPLNKNKQKKGKKGSSKKVTLADSDDSEREKQKEEDEQDEETEDAPSRASTRSKKKQNQKEEAQEESEEQEDDAEADEDAEVEDDPEEEDEEEFLVPEEEQRRGYGLRNRAKIKKTDIFSPDSMDSNSYSYGRLMGSNGSRSSTRESRMESRNNRGSSYSTASSSSRPSSSSSRRYMDTSKSFNDMMKAHNKRQQRRRKHSSKGSDEDDFTADDFQDRHDSSSDSDSDSDSPSDSDSDARPSGHQHHRGGGDHHHNRRHSSSSGGVHSISPINFMSSHHSSSPSKKGASSDIIPMVVDSKVNWDSVGGLQHHVQALKEMIALPLLYPEVFSKFNITPPRGVLFFGPPGTGKTLVARTLAATCSQAGQQPVSFFMRKGADCLSKWVGEAEKQLRLLFEEATRLQPSIIFFDEIDGLAPVRSSKQDQIHSSIVSTLLALMDGLDSRGQVVVIGATNRIDAIDPALRRPGRFDRELMFTLPGKDARAEIIDIHTKDWKPTVDFSVKELIVERSAGYCGADLRSLCTEAALRALRRKYPQIYFSVDKLAIDVDQVQVEAVDFLSAMKDIVPASHRSAVVSSKPLQKNLAPVLESPLYQALLDLCHLFPVVIPALSSKKIFQRAGNNSIKPTPILSIMNYAPAAAAASSSSSSPPLLESDSDSTVLSLPAKSPALQKKNEFIHFLSTFKPFAMPTYIHRPWLLINGPDEGCGQEHVAMAILHALEEFPVFSLAIPTLITDIGSKSMEEACVNAFAEARRCGSPSVLYIPNLSNWWATASETARHTLVMLLKGIPSTSHILVLATASCSFEELDADNLQPLFASHHFALPAAPSDDERREFFAPLFKLLCKQPHELHLHNAGAVSSTQAQNAPIVKQSKKWEQLPKASAVAASASALAGGPTPEELAQKRREEERQRMLAKYEHKDNKTLSQMRGFFRETMQKLFKSPRFKDFQFPVDGDEVKDYYQIIQNPICLADIEDKIGTATRHGAYYKIQDFMNDFHLLVSNAELYNNPKTPVGRDIITKAHLLLEFVYSEIQDLRPSFARQCEKMAERRSPQPAANQPTAPAPAGIVGLAAIAAVPAASVTLSSPPPTAAEVKNAMKDGEYIIPLDELRRTVSDTPHTTRAGGWSLEEDVQLLDLVEMAYEARKAAKKSKNKNSNRPFKMKEEQVRMALSVQPIESEHSGRRSVDSLVERWNTLNRAYKPHHGGSASSSSSSSAAASSGRPKKRSNRVIEEDEAEDEAAEAAVPMEQPKQEEKQEEVLEQVQEEDVSPASKRRKKRLSDESVSAAAAAKTASPPLQNGSSSSSILFPSDPETKSASKRSSPASASGSLLSNPQDLAPQALSDLLASAAASSSSAASSAIPMVEEVAQEAEEEQEEPEQPPVVIELRLDSVSRTFQKAIKWSTNKNVEQLDDLYSTLERTLLERLHEADHKQLLSDIRKFFRDSGKEGQEVEPHSNGEILEDSMDGMDSGSNE